MTKPYQLTQTALLQLEKEIRYSKSRWGTKHASQYRRDLLAFVRNLAENPKHYPEKPDLGKGMRCARFKGNYVVYRLSEDETRIIITNFPSIYRSSH